MKRLVTRLLVFLLVMGWPGWASAQQPSPDTPAPPAAAKEKQGSKWLLVPMLSSSPKLGTAVGGLGAG